MKQHIKKILRDYLKSIDLDRYIKNNPTIKVSKIGYIKALITFLEELDNFGLLEKIHVICVPPIQIVIPPSTSSL